MQTKSSFLLVVKPSLVGLGCLSSILVSTGRANCQPVTTPNPVAPINDSSPKSSGVSQVNSRQNYIGITGQVPIDSIGLAIISKIGFSDRLSIRPFVEFNGRVGSGYVAIGSGVTYDFNTSDSAFRPYIGTGLAYVDRLGQGTGIFGGTNQPRSQSLEPFLALGADYFIGNNLVLILDAKTLLSVNIGLGFNF
jgi:hypothetical protein